MVKSSLNVIKIMFQYARKATVLKLLFCTVSALSTSIILYATQNLIDSITIYTTYGSNYSGTIYIWIMILMAAMLLSKSLPVINSRINIEFQEKLNKKFSVDIINKFRKLPYQSFENSRYNNILLRMGDRPQERILNVFNDVIEILSLFITVFSLIILFFQVSFLVSMLYAFIIVIMMFLDFKSINMMNQMFRNQSLSERQLNYYRELLSDKHSLLELKVFGALSFIREKCKKKNENVLDERLKITIKSQKYYAFSSICIIMWISMIIFSLVSAFFHHNITVGIFASLIGSAGTVLSSTEALSFKISNVAQKCFEIGYYNEFMNMPEDITGSETYTDQANNRIEFNDVYFKYPNNENYTLKGVSFCINLNEATALVGENGSGKSTIVKLLCRLYKPAKGEILINGKDIYSFTNEEYHKIISAVFQDFVKYSLTLRENVALGAIESLDDDNKIKDILSDVVNLNSEYELETDIGKIREAGIDLSGGEWQKLAIARAYIGNSKLLVLDEPTASLDPIAESRLYSSFLQVMKHSGTFIISHRMASARLADRILVLADGQIEESGNHTSLMKNCGLYYQMFEAQSHWYLQ